MVELRKKLSKDINHGVNIDKGFRRDPISKPADYAPRQLQISAQPGIQPTFQFGRNGYSLEATLQRQNLTTILTARPKIDVKQRFVEFFTKGGIGAYNKRGPER